MTNNPWFGISMALIGIIVGFGVAKMSGGVPSVAPSPSAPPPSIAGNPSPTPPAAPEPAPSDVRPVDPKTDHIRGNVKAAVSVIEYSDFECPFCKRVHPTIQQVLEEYGDDVNWVYRHYPLSFHPNAQASAEGSECVAELGGNDAFWQFSDMIFEKGAVKEQLASYAKEVGVDEAKFTDCLDSGKYTEMVNNQLAEGSAAGVRGTPGNIILHNKSKKSVSVSGAQPFSAFQSAIDQLLDS